MVKVLLDACMPHRLRRGLVEFDVTTAHHVGLNQISDGELLAAIDGRYDVLVTRDRNLTCQQRIVGRSTGPTCPRCLGMEKSVLDVWTLNSPP